MSTTMIVLRMWGPTMTNLGSPYPKRPQPRTFKARVVAEFVDEMPEAAPIKNLKHTSWERQDGLHEALEKAFNHPGRAMLLVKYDRKGDSPSRRREMARLRAKSLEDQGYSERMGWTVRNVENEVYVMFSPVEERW